jgi:SAM-dependent methyltransferase/uncharacterized protein YbaR (Trm112 family)
MKKWLIEALICPECLDREIPLAVESQKETEEEIIEGYLICPDCQRRFAIHAGIAVVLPQKILPITQGEAGYNSFAMCSSYLWSHYSEFFKGSVATNAYKKWAAGLTDQKGWALDIGCAVGRLTFEMSKTHDRVVGIDTSISFIRAARDLAFRKHLEFDLIMEGNIKERQSCDLDPDFEFDTTEFIVADAMALPFRSHFFATTSSVNILEKVSDPARHLLEANRVMERAAARFLFSDPFSWDEAVSHADLWLGGRNEGPFQGYGMDNICRLLEEPDGFFSPRLSIRKKGQVLWKIRKTRNLWEHITSQFVMAQRTQNERR